MATRKQIAANRRNAKKSTGPRTEKGKAIARLNNLRNGLYSRADTMPAGSWQEIREIRDRFLQSCQPQSPAQYRLVARAACAEWKLLHWQQVHEQLLREAVEAASPRRQDCLRRDFADRQARLEHDLREAHDQLLRSATPQTQPADDDACLPAA